MKKQFRLFLVFLFCISFNAVAQNTFQKTYGGAGNESASAVIQSNDGGYVILGSTTSFGAGNKDVYLIKTDSVGNKDWAKTFGGTGDDIGNKILQTFDGGYIIIASTNSFGSGNGIYCIKTDYNGNVIWAKTYSGGGLNSIVQTPDSGYLIGGSNSTFVGSNSNPCLIKTDISGNVIWSKTYLTPPASDWLIDIKQTYDSSYIILGEVLIGGGPGPIEDVLLFKTNSLGDLIWFKEIDIYSGDSPTAIYQTTDSGFVIVGRFYVGTSIPPSSFLLKTNSNGIPIWYKTYYGINFPGNFNTFSSIVQANNGGLIICGTTVNTTTQNYDMIFIKTDSLGNILLAKSYGDIGSENGSTGQQVGDNGFIIIGDINSFGAGNKDIYIVKTDSNGYSGCFENNFSVAVGSYLPGFTSGSLMDTSGCVSTSPISIVDSGGLVSTLCATIGINENSNENSTLIFPNPSQGNFTIKTQNPFINGSISIFNVLGEKVFEEKIFNTTENKISLKNISQGIYFVRVSDGEKQTALKLIIQ